MAHKSHPICDHNSKAACDKARRVAIGPCASMIAEDKPCPHWGIDKVNDKPYCGQHMNSVFLAADQARRDAARKAEIDARIDQFLLWTSAHPSVWEAMPR